REITGSVPPPATKTFEVALERLQVDGTTRSDLSRALWLDSRTQLADDLLLYGDKISMAHSLEVRVPFLGAPLLAFMEGLPDKFRTTPWQSKRVLRQWAERIV